MTGTMRDAVMVANPEIAPLLPIPAADAKLEALSYT
jgi:hypothetical protein